PSVATRTRPSARPRRRGPKWIGRCLCAPPGAWPRGAAGAAAGSAASAGSEAARELRQLAALLLELERQPLAVLLRHALEVEHPRLERLGGLVEPFGGLEELAAHRLVLLP